MNSVRKRHTCQFSTQRNKNTIHLINEQMQMTFQCSNSFVTNLVSLLFYYEQNDKLFDLCDSKCFSSETQRLTDL